MGKKDLGENLIRQAITRRPGYAEAHSNLGNTLKDKGQLDESIAAYRHAITLRPNFAEAHNNLGTALKDKGQLDQAIAAYRQAIAIRPNYAEAHSNLGSALKDQGQFDEAIAAYRVAISINPSLPAAYSNLGNALMGKEQIDEAIGSYRQAIALEPTRAGAHNNLGAALATKGQFDEAITAYRQAIALRPGYAEAHNNLGNALKNKGQLDGAIAAYRQSIALKPSFADAHCNLGNALIDKGQFDEAIAASQQAITLRPGYAEAYSNLGNALKDLGRLDEAVAAYRQAFALRPGYAEAHYNLGIVLKAKGQLDEAIAAYRQAIASRPNFAEAHNNLGIVLESKGLLDEALAAYRQAVSLDPTDAYHHSNLVLTLNYHPDRDAGEILAEHRAWSDRHARPLLLEMIPHANERSPERALRIGYISADFRWHSVGHFFMPLLEHHDRSIAQIFCYSNVLHPDDMTERMSRSCDVWRNIVGLADEAVAQLVRSDGIDILVDLSGHTARNRLGVFARKPAPIQVTYLGYANTIGMTAIDYRLTDALADPRGMTDELNVEKLWRLPGCAWCYHPPEDAPDIQPRENGPITFGCFNAFAKINFKLTAIWAELLNRVPKSRLLLKSAGAGENSVQRRLTSQFAEYGIPDDRIEMLGLVDRPRRHLELYHRVDVALDTHPYHGTTTTCEALWMGVPVVSLAGRTHVSRVGLSLLNCIGLPELIAHSAEEYVSIAAGLARDLPRLAELRRTLRSRMRVSLLMDAPRFTRNIEAAYRGMWRTWCQTDSIRS
jgi:predicted O-linked N-acetylglucosamine transferase (SPINDLY family)